MNDFPGYIIESGISLAVFYTTYMLFLRSQTCFSLNRFYLLASIVFSLVIPLIQIDAPAGISFMPLVVLNEIRITPGNQMQSFPGIPAMQDILFYIYLTVSIAFLSRFLVSLIRLFILVSRNMVQEQQGFQIVFLNKNLPPFSFFRYLFIHDSYRQHGIVEVVEHEKAHIRQWHSFDILFSELLIVLQWYNPFAWLYRRALNENHEFIANTDSLFTDVLI